MPRGRGAGAGAVHVFYGPLERGRSLGSAAATLLGSSPGDFLGEGLGTADLDGDGDDELVIGSPGPFVGAGPVGDGCFATPVQPGTNRPGEAYVLTGGERLAGPLDARATADAVITGLAPGDFFGIGVGGAGDVDGDGLADLVVGANGPGTPPVGGGAAFLFAGPVDGVLRGTEASAQLFGEVPADLAGAAVAGADLDGDGRSDLMVGAPGHSAPPARPGRVYLYLRTPSGAESLGAADAVLEGEIADDHAGTALVVADLLGDGRPEFVVGAPGSATVYLLDAGKCSATVALAEASGRADGPVASSFGHALAVVDLDGDGRNELAVGAPATGTAGGGGEIAIFESPDGRLMFADARTRYAGVPGDNAGFALAVGDLDGDGVEDLAVGAAGLDGGGPGAVYVLRGQRLVNRSGGVAGHIPPGPKGPPSHASGSSDVLPVTGSGAVVGAGVLLVMALAGRRIRIGKGSSG